MKTKFRIVEEDKKFYPEMRYCFFFWGRFDERISPSSNCTMEVWRSSLKEAEEIISDYISKTFREKLKKENVKIHPYHATKNP